MKFQKRSWLIKTDRKKTTGRGAKLEEKRIRDLISSLKEDLKNSGEGRLERRVNAEKDKLSIYMHAEKSPEPAIKTLGIFLRNGKISIPGQRLKGLKIEAVSNDDLKGIQLQMTEGFEEKTFVSFCIYLLERIAGLDEMAEIQNRIKQSIKYWKDFFSVERKPLSREIQLGLAGELWVLSNILSAGLKPEQRINAWLGPRRGLHDFVHKNVLIEVKTSSSDNDRQFSIAGEDQLSADAGENLFIINPVLSRTSNNSNLNNFVDNAKNSLEGGNHVIHMLDELLGEVGYVLFDRDYYETAGENMGYEKHYVYRVDGNFPRIFPGQHAPAIRVSGYTVRADSCTESLLPSFPGF